MNSQSMVSHVEVDRKGAEFIGNKQKKKQICRHSTLCKIVKNVLPYDALPPSCK